MEKGTYIIKRDEVTGEALEAFVSETCPACNGGAKVGGLSSPTQPCPVCFKIDGEPTGLVLIPVPIAEAEAWYTVEKKRMEDDAE